MAQEYLYFFTTLKDAQASALMLTPHVPELEIRGIYDGQPLARAFCVQKMHETVNVGNILKFHALYEQLDTEQREFLKDIQKNAKCQYVNFSLIDGPWKQMFELLAENPVFTEGRVTFRKIQIPYCA